MARRVVRAPRAVALRAGALGFRARAGEVTLAGTRLGAAFESLVRYGKERGELSAAVDEEEAAAMLSVVTAEAVIRWGRGTARHPGCGRRSAIERRSSCAVSIARMTVTGTEGPVPAQLSWKLAPRFRSVRKIKSFDPERKRASPVPARNLGLRGPAGDEDGGDGEG
jgi:hypothetical protein